MALLWYCTYLSILHIVMESSDSSSDGKYDDGVYSVYDKVEDPPSSPPSQAPKVKPPKLPTAMLVCMAILLTCCFVGILLSGLHFGHKVEEGDCLAQSCIMFSVRTFILLGTVLLLVQTPHLLLLLNSTRLANDLSEPVHTGPVVHRPAPAGRSEERATRSTAAVLHAPASLVSYSRRAPRHRRLGHLSHHHLRGRLQGPRARVVCEPGRLHRCDVSRRSSPPFPSVLSRTVENMSARGIFIAHFLFMQRSGPLQLHCTARLMWNNPGTTEPAEEAGRFEMVHSYPRPWRCLPRRIITISARN